MAHSNRPITKSFTSQCLFGVHLNHYTVAGRHIPIPFIPASLSLNFKMLVLSHGILFPQLHYTDPKLRQVVHITFLNTTGPHWSYPLVSFQLPVALKHLIVFCENETTKGGVEMPDTLSIMFCSVLYSVLYFYVPFINIKLSKAETDS